MIVNLQHFLNESKSLEIEKFKSVLKLHPKLSVLPISMSPEGKKISKIYRTVRQPSLFDDIYGTHNKTVTIGSDQRPFCLSATYTDNGPMPVLPKTKPMILIPEESDTDDPEWRPTTDWTIDPDYYYQVHDECIRVCLDFEKVKKFVSNEDILNLLHDGEAEIRIRKPIPLLETIDHIEIVEELYYEDVEGEYGIDRAIKSWFPKELEPYLKLTDSMPMHTPSYCKVLQEYYKVVYAKYRAKPVKPYGNTWIDQKD